MTMAPRLRKLALTAHVTSSVGWLGAVVASLGLAILGLTSRDTELVRSVYLTLEPLGWYVLVPSSVASLVTGTIQSLGTPWGLVQHYWVVVKLVMNVGSTLILLLYMQSLDYFADLAQAGASVDEMRNPSPALHAGVAVILLVTATALSVYKPKGLTRHGQRKQEQRRATSPAIR